ncbi:Panacea domain-containing protein [Bacteroides zoogleoformans]|uniref:Panacea domain-containing protein n=1 Tax=Bacteroides zoogleoformans TaxID=28119 RepID=UPI00248D9347|nr:Panacea domain-containing protein [Bacteroides zoogleoformans]
MTHFDKQRLTEIVLYILNKTKGLDYYHIFKVIYFANIVHLAKYGCPMVSDVFCALPDGPVPSILYNCVKGDQYCDKELQSMLDDSILKGRDDAYYMLEAKRKFDETYLSKADIEVLDRSISENANLPYGDLRSKSHGKEWERAYAQQGRKVMDVVGMAKDGMASDDMIEYIKAL